MHLGSPDPTEGPCFTIKDYMHRARHVTYTIKIIAYLYIITHWKTGKVILILDI